VLCHQVRWYDYSYIITASGPGMSCADTHFCPLPVRPPSLQRPTHYDACTQQLLASWVFLINMTRRTWQPALYTEHHGRTYISVRGSRAPLLCLGVLSHVACVWRLLPQGNAATRVPPALTALPTSCRDVAPASGELCPAVACGALGGCTAVSSQGLCQVRRQPRQHVQMAAV
jgi:hypothetical protein